MNTNKVPFLLMLVAACGSGGGGGTTEPLPPLQLENVAVLPGRDTAVVLLRVNRHASIRMAYVPVGRTDSMIASTTLSGSGQTVIRGLEYEQQYVLSATAIVPGQPNSSFPPVNFLTPTPPDPCATFINSFVVPVDLKFEHRPKPGPDESIHLFFVDGVNCDGSFFVDNGEIISLDTGVSFQQTYKVKPNLPFGTKPLTLRAGVFRAGKQVRWLAPNEFTLNGKNATRLTEVRPAPPTCAAEAECFPGPAVIFDLNTAGVIDP